jgi:AcrR family transcriptional regulator
LPETGEARDDGSVTDDRATPAPVRRGRPGHDQATVLRRAIELFNAQGHDATSIGDLAKDLGLTKSAIYHHVPSKEALLSAALDEALDGLSAAIDVAVDPDVLARSLASLAFDGLAKNSRGLPS